MPVATKAERLATRVTAEQKQLLLRAADLTGRSLTGFVIGSAQEAAMKTIRDHGVVTLAVRDQEPFVKALLNPPNPNARLRLAWKRYRKHRGR